MKVILLFDEGSKVVGELIPAPHVSNVKHKKSMNSASALTSISHNPTQRIRLLAVTS